MNKSNFWKKGDKVVRIYGSDNWGVAGAMMPGDVGTLAEDQKYPGIVRLQEFTRSYGHDPIRLRRIKDYKGFSPQELTLLWKMVDEHDFEGVVKFAKRKIKQKI